MAETSLLYFWIAVLLAVKTVATTKLTTAPPAVQERCTLGTRCIVFNPGDLLWSIIPPEYLVTPPPGTVNPSRPPSPPALPAPPAPPPVPEPTEKPPTPWPVPEPTEKPPAPWPGPEPTGKPPAPWPIPETTAKPPAPPTPTKPWATTQKPNTPAQTAPLQPTPAQETTLTPWPLPETTVRPPGPPPMPPAFAQSCGFKLCVPANLSYWLCT